MPDRKFWSTNHSFLKAWDNHVKVLVRVSAFVSVNIFRALENGWSLCWLFFPSFTLTTNRYKVTWTARLWLNWTKIFCHIIEVCDLWPHTLNAVLSFMWEHFVVLYLCILIIILKRSFSSEIKALILKTIIWMFILVSVQLEGLYWSSWPFHSCRLQPHEKNCCSSTWIR